MDIMSNLFRETTSSFRISVRTSDRYGAGTDAAVYINLIDKYQKKSQTKKLDAFFRNDFERGQIDNFKMKTEFVMDDIVEIEIWRDNFGLGGAWHLEYVSVENVKTKLKVTFPYHRWLVANVHYFIEAYDCSLPQHCKYDQQRNEEMKERKKSYQYKESYPNLPLQILNVPDDELFSDTYTWDLGMHKLSLLMEKVWVGTFYEDKKGYFEKLDDVVKMFDRFKSMPYPKDVEHWKEDTYFGNTRLNGCNPKLICLCKEIPKTFAVDKETVKPLLEGKTFEEAMQAKKFFIIDLTMLEGIPTKDDVALTNPYCLLYLRDNKELVPVAIQLYKQPGPTNPVFYPSDDANLWLLAKMWYCLADASYHQAAAHLGATHLMMEGICVAMNKTMSLSHPVHKLLAPHFLFLLAINDRALSKLVAPGGWIDLTMAIGRIGLFEIVAKRYNNYDIMGEGDLLADLKRRGVDDEEVLPEFHYRDDGVLLYNLIKKYATDMVKTFYVSEKDILEDTEIQAWRQELIKPKPDGLGYKGIPGDGKFSTYEDLTTLITYIIFSCSVEHAAVNFSQYDSYAFPLGYPVRMRGSPPKNKSPVTEDDLVKTLNHKEHMMNTMVVTRMLSERGTKALGDFEVVYHHRPDIVAIVEKFQADLKLTSYVITRRDTMRKVPYLILNPAEVPNAISI